MSNNPQNPKDKIQNILEKIRTNELTLKSKQYFNLKFAALIILILAVFIVSIFLSSFIVFMLRVGGHASLVGFGPSGWKLFILEIALIILLEWFLRSFRFGYKVPVLYLLSGILGLMLITGFLVDKTSLHDLLLRRADEHHLPGAFRDFYEGVRRPPPQGYGVFRGTVANVDSGGLIVNLDNPDGIGTTTPVKVSFTNPDADMVAKVGDRVFIKGEMVNGEIHAHGMRNANDMPPPRVERE